MKRERERSVCEDVVSVDCTRSGRGRTDVYGGNGTRGEWRGGDGGVDGRRSEPAEERDGVFCSCIVDCELKYVA